jgi:hypothetical protein
MPNSNNAVIFDGFLLITCKGIYFTENVKTIGADGNGLSGLPIWHYVEFA